MEAELYKTETEVVNAFIDRGFDMEEISNEIDALRINSKSKPTTLAMYNHLKAKFKEKPKEYKVATTLSDISPVIVSTYPTNYQFSDVRASQGAQIQYDKIEELYFLEEATVIESQLSGHLSMLKAKFSETYGIQPARITEASDTEIFIIGRVQITEVNDIEVIYLADEQGRIELNLESLQTFKIFPGQILMAKGVSNMLKFTVSELITKPYLPVPRTITFLQKTLIAAISGPFSTPELDFSKFIQVVEHLSSKVNTIIIIGPIVDQENELLKSGNFSVFNPKIINGSFEDIFEAINENLKRISTASGCKFVLVPHEREMCHIFPMPMPSLSFTYRSDLHLPPAPAKLLINNIRVDVVPYDITLELNSLLKIKSNVLINKTNASLNSIFEQQSYMPMIPNGFPVEYAKYQHFLITSPPSLFLTTSQLRIDPEAVEGMLCIKLTPFFVDSLKLGHFTVIDVNAGTGPIKDLVGIKHFKLN